MQDCVVALTSADHSLAGQHNSISFNDLHYHRTLWDLECTYTGFLSRLLLHLSQPANLSVYRSAGAYLSLLDASSQLLFVPTF